ncbi:MAG: sulfatase-like hydrolase/transferase, partial [Bacteroidia bacterium]|nr:sulfatase-like hydrolase/transferase [Bacteroidia bacterium]
PDFFWGYHDEFTFTRSLEVIDSLNKEPRLDIYLTLSTHHPFHTPNADYYLKAYKEITSMPGFPSEKKKRTDLNREIFSSVLYTDDALRNFLKEYAERDDFNNTIFFITGDHFFMELGYSNISAIERYHVPMIIYSPLLKKPHHFESVSSHQDIPTSLIAMLQARYHFMKLPYVHWLGKGIDTVTEFRNTHIMQFVTSSQKYVDYLDNEYFLSNNRLYKIRTGLKTVLVQDEIKLKKLQEDLSATTVVSSYATGKDRVILRELFMKVKFDTTTIYSIDTSGYFFGGAPSHFINLIRPFQFDSDYRSLKYELDFQYFLPDYSDTSKVPRLIISLEDSNYKNIIYHQLPFPGSSTLSKKPGQWHSFHFKEVLDVSSIEDLTGLYVKLYLFNNKLSNIRCDNLKFRIQGIN